MILWGRNRIALSRIYDDHDADWQVGWWLNGKILGRYVSVLFPWRTYRPWVERPRDQEKPDGVVDSGETWRRRT
jgi:hypothetical protein